MANSLPGAVLFGALPDLARTVVPECMAELPDHGCTVGGDSLPGLGPRVLSAGNRVSSCGWGIRGCTAQSFPQACRLAIEQACATGEDPSRKNTLLTMEAAFRGERSRSAGESAGRTCECASVRHSRARMEAAIVQRRGSMRNADWPATIPTTEIHWRGVHPQRRVETPSEWIVENALARNEGVRRKPGIPIPAGTEPSGPVPAVHGIRTSGIYIGLSQIVGAQAAPAI